MNTETIPIQGIFVPQGAEYNAVCRGLQPTQGETPSVFATPAGVSPSQHYFTTWLETHSPQAYPHVLFMGLCGGLSPKYEVGDGVLYQSCLSSEEISPQPLACHGELIQTLHTRLSLPIVTGITRDRAITTATAKQALHYQYQADVVDMESYPVLKILNQVGIKSAILRVVSDDCHRDLPNLDAVLDAGGNLQPLPLISSFIRQPIAATRLIRGSLKGLQALEKLTLLLSNPQQHLNEDVLTP
jgi:nucleoside phosphorylase